MKANTIHDHAASERQQIIASTSQPKGCKLCGGYEYVDPTNGEHYGYCVNCIIGTFGQVKDHNVIFAAPDLLEACKAAYDLGCAMGCECDPDHHASSCWLGKIEAAIAKATNGQQPN